MPKTLVIFVHGFGGGDDSWSGFSEAIASDASLTEEANFEFFTYPTERVWFVKTKSLSLGQIAAALTTHISTRQAEYRQVLLVCHSMGGLVAKRCIADIFARGEATKVKGVVFIATPHSGAEFANIGAFLQKNHRHLAQMAKQSDFVELTATEWAAHGLDDKFSARYVIAANDFWVRPESALGGRSRQPDVILGKDHISISSINSAADDLFLIVRQATLTLAASLHDDIDRCAEAMLRHDDHGVVAICANNGRSWIETEEVDRALEVLRQVRANYAPTTEPYLWARYLLVLAGMFRDQDFSNTAIDEELIEAAKPFGLSSLFVAERMELSRKRGDLSLALEQGNDLKSTLDNMPSPRAAGEAYAMGTAHFLLGNLYRAGGRYDLGLKAITAARELFRPTLLSHQIELAHCRYAAAICGFMAQPTGEDLFASQIGSEMRVFSSALFTLVESNRARISGDVNAALFAANEAAQRFASIGYRSYALRAERASQLLEIWRRLELGASADVAVHGANELRPTIAGLLGDPAAVGALLDLLKVRRPSYALGLLQFAAAFNPDWGAEIEAFDLPPILVDENGTLQWRVVQARSFADADRQLRGLMAIPSHVNIPLVAD